MEDHFETHKIPLFFIIIFRYTAQWLRNYIIYEEILSVTPVPIWRYILLLQYIAHISHAVLRYH